MLVTENKKGAKIAERVAEQDEFVIRIPKTSPMLSSTKKTFAVASSGGFSGTGLVIDGKPVSASVIVNVPNPDYVKP